MGSAGPAAANLGGAGLRVAIVASRFNEEITGELLKRARDEARRLGVQVEEKSVPGALEIPVALQWMAQSGRFDALVAVGCVIRGETYHFEVIADAVARGVTDAAGETGIPIAFGVLTTDTLEQALARAAMDRTNKGWEAAVAAIEMARLVRQVSAPVARGASAEGTRA